MTLRTFPSAQKAHSGNDVMLAPESVDYISPLYPPDDVVCSDKPCRTVYMQSGAFALIADGPELEALIAELSRA